MELKYIVYLTINLCNGKFYIGVHKTNPNTFDGYIGCGIYRQSEANQSYPFHKAVRKYGYSSFKRTTLRIFPNTEEGKLLAYKLEASLVTDTVIKSKECYNITNGGNTNLCLSKSVFQFDLGGNFLRRFQNAREAAKTIGPDVDTILKGIKNNCLGTTNSSYGYFWSYKKQFNYKNNLKTRVAQYTLSGKFLRYFDSLTEAEEQLQVNSIGQAITKHIQCGRYQWRYYFDDDTDIPKLANVFTKINKIPILMIKDDKVEEFNSIKDCVHKYPNLQSQQISRVIRGIIKTHKGYIFKYKDKDIV